MQLLFELSRLGAWSEDAQFPNLAKAARCEFARASRYVRSERVSIDEMEALAALFNHDGPITRMSKST